MKIETHTEDGTTSTVLYSDCDAYRYALTRTWVRDGGLVNFIMLNPSVADAFANDPTVERCERRARALGFGSFCVTNIFAWRDTDPTQMRKAAQPIGPENDRILQEQAKTADCVVVAWGTHGAHLARGAAVAQLLRVGGVDMHHLGLTKHGHPRHPLYVSYKKQLERWIPHRD